MENSITTTYNNTHMSTTAKAEYAFVLTLCSLFLLMLFIGDASAAGAKLEKAICNISIVAQTNVAKGIATLAIIMLGIGAMLGKISWSMALLVAVGIAIVFNAGSVVGSLGGTQCSGVN